MLREIREMLPSLLFAGLLLAGFFLGVWTMIEQSERIDARQDEMVLTLVALGVSVPEASCAIRGCP